MKNCDLCNKTGRIHYRVKSIKHNNWIFCCHECWNIVSKHRKYLYEGTRKSNSKKNFCKYDINRSLKYDKNNF